MVHPVILSVVQMTADAQTTQTVWEFLSAGGVLMLPIAICSVVVLGFAFERFLLLRSALLVPRNVSETLDLVQGEDCAAAQRRVEEGKTLFDRILRAGLRRRQLSLRDVELAMEDQAQKEAEKLKRNIRPISVVASIAPLLGLLGTVIGIAEAFHRVKIAGTGRPELLAEGIEMALVTTIAGLSVAIPALLIAAYLNGRVRKIVLSVDEQISGVAEHIPQQRIAA